MNFYRHKYNILLIICLVFVLGKGDTQVISLPNDVVDANASANINNYYKVYPEVPPEPIVEVNWYKSPEDISRRMELNNIAHSTRYFDDGTPYLEKEVYGLKSRLFLKETKGHRYTIYDLKYVPYKDDPEIIKKDREEAERKKIEEELKAEEEQKAEEEKKEKEAKNKVALEEAQEKVPAREESKQIADNSKDEQTVVKEGEEDATKEGEVATALGTEIEQEIVEIIKTTALQDHEKLLLEPITPLKDDNPLRNSIVPEFWERNSGSTLYVDVVIQSVSDVSKREKLYRYAGKGERIYIETYNYTDKGALQRLNREFANGAVQRYIYYFSTGGLKDVFYQDPDGSTYLLSYTLAGNLLSKILYNTNKEKSYELYNTYNDNDALISQVETNYENRLEIQSVFKDSYVSEKKFYTLKLEEDIEKEREEKEKEEAEKVEGEASLQKKSQEEDQQESEAQKEIASVSDANGEDNKDTTQGSAEEEDLNLAQTDATPKDRTIVERVLLKTEDFEYSPAGEQIKLEERNILHEDIVRVEEKDGETKEIKLRDGNVISEVIKKGDERIQIYYFRGEPILKVYYDRKKKYKEEVINNGEVIETRQER